MLASFVLWNVQSTVSAAARSMARVWPVVPMVEPPGGVEQLMSWNWKPVPARSDSETV